ncbi:hypothetical protein [Streptomyces sp. NPDC046939]|uniref:hypothetical protein n=1 Tax=Streptomyces sp. NPDC046939 TaxID=3155376 RepID=UPI0033DC7B17
MTPLIMGNADRPELGEELRNSPEMARVFARTTFLSDARDDLKGIGVPTLILECSEHAGPAASVIAALSGLLSGLGEGLDDDTALLALGVPTTAATTKGAP